ncbi:MAG: ribonuclease P protein subunit [Candidatus Bathyarchaeota archaeon]
MKFNSNIIQDEFIGLESKVVKSLNNDSVGITGKIIYETRNTFTILQNNTKKVVIKDISIFNFVMFDGTVIEIDGKTIIGRPEDRIKKRLRRLW